MNDPALPWSVGLWLLAALLLIGCATRPPAPDVPAPPDDLGALSLLVERAVFATATQRCAECPACHEDFQSTFDILDVMLDERMTKADLVNALSWMKVDKLTGTDGALLLTADDVLIVSEGVLIVSEGRAPRAPFARPIRPDEVETVAMAVWVGLNKWVGGR